MTEQVCYYRKVARKNPLQYKKNMTAQLTFAKLHVNKLQMFGNNIFYTD